MSRGVESILKKESDNLLKESPIYLPYNVRFLSKEKLK